MIGKSENELVQDILKSMELVEARSDATYDGVLGSLPEWVPEPVQKNFVAVRNRVIGNWGYEPGVAVEWLNRFLSIGSEEDQWFYPGVYPCGRELDPDFFIETIGYLAHLRWAVSLGAENGLSILGGEYALRGYRNAKNLKPRSITRLTILIDQTYKRLADRDNEAPTAKRVLENLEVNDWPAERIIEEIDWVGEVITWVDFKGKVKDTKFGQFNNKVSEAKKRYFQGNG